ncbi:MAG: RIP metalloprotease RseP, partial [Gammaproteobacteria bacterium]|nr:RIP metalloprotease RseP [Gammaproteobacteria bacterium]
IFSILAYMVMFSIGVPGQAPIIGEVELNSIAYENNIRSGDKIISVGEKSVTTWQTSLISMIGEILKDEKIEILIVDETNNQKKINLDLTGRTKELTAPNALFSGLGFRPFQPIASPVIVNISPNSPAEKSGLLAEDTILKLDNISIKSPAEFSEMIGSRPNETIVLEIKRGNEIYQTEVLLESNRDNPSKGFIGISMTIDEAQLEQYLAVQKYSFPKNFTMALDQTNQMIVLTLNMFGKMISGQISGKNLSGPVGIAKDAGTVAKRGLIATLSFMAIISVSLGILNLLPLPVLDGGQIVFVLIEKVIRRPLPDKIQIVFQQIGVGALLFLMVFALYNDIIRLFS